MKKTANLFPRGIEASTEQTYTVTKADLPLCCPMPDMRLWDSHPRVYLPIEVTGKAVCPYCNTHYFLKNNDYTQRG